jgi:hypothetical protein
MQQTKTPNHQALSRDADDPVVAAVAASLPPSAAAAGLPTRAELEERFEAAARSVALLPLCLRDPRQDPRLAPIHAILIINGPPPPISKQPPPARATKQLAYFEPGTGGVLAHGVAKAAAALKVEPDALGGAQPGSVDAGVAEVSEPGWSFVLSSVICALLCQTVTKTPTLAPTGARPPPSRPPGRGRRRPHRGRRRRRGRARGRGLGGRRQGARPGGPELAAPAGACGVGVGGAGVTRSLMAAPRLLILFWCVPSFQHLTVNATWALGVGLGSGHSRAQTGAPHQSISLSQSSKVMMHGFGVEGKRGGWGGSTPSRVVWGCVGGAAIPQPVGFGG